MEIEKIILSLSAMTLLATSYRNQLLAVHALPENAADDDAIDQAWALFEEAKAELNPDADDDRDDWETDPPDWETQQAERDRRDYEAGKAEAETRQAERKIYGDALADTFHRQDDLNAYNRGEE